jgi:hypothetical protein
LNVLIEKDLQFEATSMVDPIGRVFRHQCRIFRLVKEKEAASLYHNLLNSGYIDPIFKSGLVKTWLPNDIAISSAELLLEHQRLAFMVHPAEMTNTLITDSVRMLIHLQKSLFIAGVQLKDCHPWNIMLDKGKPVYIDFGSVVEYSGRFCTGWYEELKRFYLIPLWLHKVYGEKFSQEYRREHLKGFGQLFAHHTLIKECGFPQPVKSDDNIEKISQLLDDILIWLDQFTLKAEPKQWSGYQQSGDQNDPLLPVSEKHKFVFEWLSDIQPKIVLDMAANKGFYSEVAARLGGQVICFDNEEFNVDACNTLAFEKDLNITAVLMDFLHPTPASGIGLTFPDAYQRFSADTILVLGLIHHICIGLGIPLHVFLSFILRYQPSNIIIEFVFTDDIHILPWGGKSPDDYHIDNLKTILFYAGFMLAEERLIGADGVHRAMLTFIKPDLVRGI